MKPIAVTEKLAVAPQPKLSDFQEFKRQGFTTVVNNRPDGEGPGQLGSAAEEAAAHAAGLGYLCLLINMSRCAHSAMIRYSNSFATDSSASTGRFRASLPTRPAPSCGAILAAIPTIRRPGQNRSSGFPATRTRRS